MVVNLSVITEEDHLCRPLFYLNFAAGFGLLSILIKKLSGALRTEDHVITFFACAPLILRFLQTPPLQF